MQYKKTEAKEFAREKFVGLWGAPTYSYGPDGKLDLEGLKHNIRYYAEVLKVQGVFVGGFVDEHWSLSVEERKEAIGACLEAARGEIVVAPMTTHHCMADCLEMTRFAQEMGAEIAIIMNPYLAARTEKTIFEFFHHLCERVEIGISLFNSGYAGYYLTPDQISVLADIPNVCAIKNAIMDVRHTAEVFRKAGNRLVVSDPEEAHLLHSVQQFGQQLFHSSPTLHLFQTPEDRRIERYFHLARAGKYAEAREVHTSLASVRALAKKWLWEPWYNNRLPIAHLKYWSELMGMEAQGGVRPPLENITEEEKEALRADLESVGLMAKLAA